jgi:phosphopantetheinyl transferase (holo-ACP synthase)
MIGNDVIDLALARSQSNWKRKGFLEKIFTEEERRLILESSDPETMVWAFWSRKEAAYKIFNRQTGLRLYNPQQFECLAMKYVNGYYLGEVRNSGNVYYSKTEINSRFIYTIAVQNPEDFNTINHSGNVEIKKKNHIPFAVNALGDFEKPVSISHHGLYKRIVSF